MNRILFFFIFFISNLSLFAQDALVEFGKNKINIDEKFFIKLTIKGTESRPIVVFPEIEGFKKADKPTTTGISIQNGKTIFTHIFIQNYTAIIEGTHKIPKGFLKYGEKSIEFNDYFITIFDPFNAENLPKKTDIIVEKEHSSFELKVNKQNVYKGEGIHVLLVFNIFEDNTAVLEFPDDLNKKIENFEKKLKPKNCWEEKTVYKEIKSEKVQINGKNATQYKLFESTYYPLDTKKIEFSSLNLDMIRIKLLNGGNKKIKLIKTFSTDSKTINIKKLPPHPLENTLFVGDFELKEILKKRKVETGESFPLELIISGIGNFNLINQPILTNDIDFDFYSPTVKETNLSSGNNIGKKHFIFNIVPKKTGIKSLEKYINFIFFNTKKQKYDTLRPKSLIEIVGKNIISNNKKENNTENFTSIFDGLENENIDKPYFNFFNFVRQITNVFCLIMFLILIFLFIKNPK